MLITRRTRTPRCTTALQFCFCDVELQQARLKIDRDRVTFFDERDHPADCRLGRNMADDHPVSAAGKSSIRNQTNRITESGADDSGRGRQHLAHARSTLWSFIANHDNVAGLDCSGKNYLQAILFRIEYPSGAGDAMILDAANLRYRSFDGEITFQNCEMALRVNR